MRLARSTGASCKFCGSGGAVVGSYEGDEMLRDLERGMKEGNYEFIVPEVSAGNV